MMSWQNQRTILVRQTVICEFAVIDRARTNIARILSSATLFRVVCEDGYHTGDMSSCMTGPYSIRSTFETAGNVHCMSIFYSFTDSPHLPLYLIVSAITRPRKCQIVPLNQGIRGRRVDALRALPRACRGLMQQGRTLRFEVK